MTTFRTPAASISGSRPQRDQAPRGDAHVSRRLPAVAVRAPNFPVARAVTRPAGGALPRGSRFPVSHRPVGTVGAALARLASPSTGSRTRALGAARVARHG